MALLIMPTQLHWDAMTDDCRRAFEFLAGQAFLREFYLAGGTALALQLGHRVSTDLDWFSSSWTLLAAQRGQITQWLGASGDFDPALQADGLMFGRVLGADVSFIYLPVPPLEPTVTILNVAVASPVDIGLMKLVAIRDRGRRRDFIDLFCLKEVAPLNRLIELVELKYAAFPDMLPTVARGLAYFEDAEREPMPRMLWQVRWEDVRRYAEHGARMIVERERRKWR